MINDANADKDSVTGLRAPTNFGRPNWAAIFKGIRKIHSPGAAGAFFCGPKGLGSTLHVKCNEYSDPGRFIHGYSWHTNAKTDNLMQISNTTGVKRTFEGFCKPSVQLYDGI